jgi:hypothetical protein
MRWRSALLTACSAFLLAGCGGGDPADSRMNAAPTIQRPVARQLATRSDEVARLLETGNACAAVVEASRLRADLTRAIDRHLIPQRYRTDLIRAVHEIRGQIVCRREPPPPPPSEDGGKKKGKKHGKGHGRGGHR